jgi:quercetin dioxygenase-like cupin family protein
MLRPFRYCAVRLGAVLLVCAASAGAQAVIDNEQVRVLKVTEQPHRKTRPHEHKVNRVMIYLNAGKQEFVEDGKTSHLEFKAGQPLWSPARGTHTAESGGTEPFTVIEVELKKDGAGKAPQPALDPVKVDPKHYMVEFENAQVRVLRVIFPRGEGAPLHEHLLNRVVVYVHDAKVEVTTDGKPAIAERKAGEVSWGAPAKHSEKNVASGPFEVIAVEVKN